MKKSLDLKAKIISPYFILFICCLPLLFFNLKNSHDWGGDFAMYIMQAKNIIEGKSMSETGYIYLTNNAVLGPPAYLSGFPLLLAPIYYFFGNNLIAFFTLINLFLIGIAMFSFYFFKKLISSSAVAILLVLVMVYNPWVLDFKGEIMSEIPFTFFLLLCLFIFEKSKTNNKLLLKIILGFFVGFLMSLRPNGVVFVIALGIYYLSFFLVNFFTSNKLSALKKLALDYDPIFTAVIFFVLLNNVIFDIPQGAVGSYNHIFDFNELSNVVSSNLDYYFIILQSFFLYSNENWTFISTFSQSLFLVFVVLGFFKKIFHRFEFSDLLFLLLFSLILIYPYQKGGLRFLFPLFPFLFFYFIYWIKHSFRLHSEVASKFLSVICLLVLLFQYKTAISKIWEERNLTIWGPQHEKSIAVFDFINNNLKENAVIEFEKPRVLSLYTKIKSIGVNPTNDLQVIINDWKKNQVSHLLYLKNKSNLIPDNQLEKLIYYHQNKFEIIFENEKFQLFSIEDFLRQDLSTIIFPKGEKMDKLIDIDFEKIDFLKNINNYNISSNQAFSGRKSALIDRKDEFSLEIKHRNFTENFLGIKVKGFAYLEKRKDCFLVLEINNKEDKNAFYQSFNIKDFINKNEAWESFEVFFNIENINDESHQYKIYFWNKGAGKLFIDDLKVAFFD